MTYRVQHLLFPLKLLNIKNFVNDYTIFLAISIAKEYVLSSMLLKV